MKITETKLNAFLEQYSRLSVLASDFVSEAAPRGRDAQLETDGGVSYEVNTACNCHPEYERQYLSKEDFLKFIKTNQEKVVS